MDTGRWILTLGCLACVACGTSHSSGRDAGSSMDAASTDSGVRRDAPARDAGAISFACRFPSDCVVVPRSCCGNCGAATAEDLLAIPVSEREAYVRRAECASMPCPRCAAAPDPYLIATCRAGRCEAINLHVDPVTACDSPSDCVLGAARCCACGLIPESEVIAYNPAISSARLEDYLCADAGACPPCAPIFPSQIGPYCDPETGHCRTVVADD